ncbi:MAG: glutamate 5-kinase [Bacteroidia bacterium]|nr:glutamate 5-kinase [Bacteroidia bacterium]
MSRPILVLKAGTASITRPDGSLDEPVMVDMAAQIARLHADYRVLIVSSGAVGAGKRFLPAYSGQITERKAAAAIGNPLLMNKYAQFLAPYGIAIAQSLCERQHFANRTQFLQLRDTFETLWDNQIIPIANENDVVSNRELKFSDNDELATLMAVGFGASLLLLGTSVPGVLDAQGQVVREIARFDAAVLGLATRETSGTGLGGMISKLTFARLATRMGIRTVIFGVRTPGSILRAVAGETGTICLPQETHLSSRSKWLGSGSLVIGRIEVDAGACEALMRRRSLLAVGVRAVPDEFDSGEVVEIAPEGGLPFAVARVRLSSAEILDRMGIHNVEIAHADDIVLLD